MNQNIKIELEHAVKGNIKSKNIIIDYYTDYINNLIKNKYKDINIDYNELLNIGLLAVLEILEKTNEIQNIDHQKIICCIKKDINTFITNENKFNDSKLRADTYIHSSLEDRELILEINKAIDTLSKKQKNIIYLYFYKNYTLQEIGKIYNVTRERIRQNISQALANINKELNKHNITPNIKSNYNQIEINNKKNQQKYYIDTNFILQRLKPILLNYNNLEIENALNELKKPDLIMLGKSLRQFNDGNNDKYVSLMIEKIKLLIIEEKIANNNLNFYDFFPNYQKEKIDYAISLLSKDDKILVDFLINNNGLLCKLINGALKFEINEILYKITKILQNKQYVISLRTNFIYKKFYNYSEEEIDFALSLLNNNDKALLNLNNLTTVSEINFVVERIFDEIEQTIKVFHLIFMDKKNIYNILNQYNKIDIDNIINELESIDLKIWNTKCNGDINLGIKKYYIYTDKIIKKIENCKKIKI